LGAAIAARDGKLLTLATGEFLPRGPIGAAAHTLAAAIGALVATVFGLAGVALVRSDRAAGSMLTEAIPVWVADLALPIGFALIAARLVWRAWPAWQARLAASLGIVAGILVNANRAALSGHALTPWLLFALLGGIALFASLTLGNPPVVLPMMAYQELTTSTGVAAIPLFTLAGFLLAEGRSSERLLRVFRAWFGWAPGGPAIAAATLCAFFT